MKKRWGLLEKIVFEGEFASKNIIDRRDVKPIKRRGKVSIPDPRKYTERTDDTLNTLKYDLNQYKQGPTKPIKLKYQTGAPINDLPHYIRTPKGPIRSKSDRTIRAQNIMIDVILDQIINKKTGKK